MWNCRELGIPGTVQELSRLVREKDPLVLFVVESRLDKARLEVLHCQFHFSSKLVVPRREQGEGLVMFWKQEAHVSIKSFSHHHINAIIDEDATNPWRLTGFYGAPETHRHHESWSLLRLLHGQYNLSWCNNRLNTHTVWERLDRVLATSTWISHFPNAQVHHLHAVSSDHSPLSIQITPPPTSRPRPKRIFTFEEMWLSHRGCKETVTAAWQSQKLGTAMFQV